MQNYHLKSIFSIALILASCSNYDEPSIETEQSNDFFTFHDEPNHMTLKIDATDFSTWNYISLKNKTVEKYAIPTTCEGEWDGRSGLTYLQLGNGSPQILSTSNTDAQPEPSEWDFAIHFFDVKTNGATACATDFQSLDELPDNVENLNFIPDTWSTSQVIVDRKEMMSFKIGYQNSYVNTILSGWVTMDISTPPPTYKASNKVYVMKLKNGTKAAMCLVSYMNESGEKGHLTIDIIYPWP